MEKGIETVQLWFQPGDRREGFRWSAAYQGRMVGLCGQPFCEICNLTERENLKGFRGGELEVTLVPYRRPTFWKEEIFYLGHLVKVPEREAVRVVGVDEGIEFDISRLNTLLCTTTKGSILIDPGLMGFNADELGFQRLIGSQRIVATIITHGHLDHWNHLGETRGRVFMTKLAYQLASRHAAWQRDGQLVGALRRATLVVPGDPILLDGLPFKVDTFSLPHSIPETMGLVIKGTKKRVVHLADFKLSGWDGESKAKTIAILQEIAKEKVDILALTIINAHLPGFVPIETLVIDTLTDILAGAKGRVVITCFSSNLERIRRIVEVAQLRKRPVAFYGAGMKNSQELLGIKTEEGATESKEAVIFVTGCQAEENSVLWRIATRQSLPFELWPSDTLVFSSRGIPGKETELSPLTTNLRPRVDRLIVHRGEVEQLGLKGLGVEEMLIHISGHEYGGGLQLVSEILRPKQALAWPQVSPQIEAFRKIAEPLGIEILDEKERVIEI